MLLSAMACPNIWVVVMIPEYGPRSMGFEATVAAELAMKTMNNDEGLTMLRGHNVTLKYVVIETGCDSGIGLYKLIEEIMSRRGDPCQEIRGVIGK